MYRCLSRAALFATLSVVFSVTAYAQNQFQTSGTQIVIPAFAEVSFSNDEAHVTFMVEEQDKDKSAAASRVNRKMKEGVALIKQKDQHAVLKTRGYYTYPVYAEELAAPPRANAKPRPISSWRVGQYVDVTTQNLDGLPKTVAAAQGMLALNGLQFGLSPATVKKLDEQRIAAAYQNFAERVAAMAKAMGRNVAEASLESIDLDGATPVVPQYGQAAMAVRAAPSEAAVSVAEPSFEPGETTLQVRLVGKIKFK